MLHICNASSAEFVAVRTGCASARASINALATGYRCSGSIVLLLSIFNVLQWSLALLNLHLQDTVRREKKQQKTTYKARKDGRLDRDLEGRWWWWWGVLIGVSLWRLTSQESLSKRRADVLWHCSMQPDREDGERGRGRREASWNGYWLTVTLIYRGNDGAVVSLIDWLAGWLLTLQAGRVTDWGYCWFVVVFFF